MMSGSKERGEKKFESAPKFVTRIVSSKLFLLLTFIWFTLQALFMAFSTRQGIPPDENYHISFIRLYTENGWLPSFHDQTGHYDLGAVSHTPFFLYHYLLSLPNHFFGHSDFSVFALRSINILMGLGSLYLVYKLANFLKLPTAVRNLSIFMLVNTMMFVFLAAAVSYDNLFVLLSLGGVYLVFLIKEKPTLFRLLWLLVVITAGLMIKVNFIPIALIIVAILLLIYFKDGHKISKQIKVSAQESKKANIILGLVLAILLILFTQKYVVNVIQYRALSPSCTQVLSVQQCLQNPIFERRERLNGTERPPANKSLYEYIANWVYIMDQRTYGVMAHKSFTPTKIISGVSLLFIVFSVILVIRKITSADRYIKMILAIIIFYTFILMLKNYRTYKAYGVIGFAVQPRYLFAVLPLMYLMANKYIWEFLRSNIARAIFSVIIVISFLTAGLPSYIYRTSPSWHTKDSVKINSQLKGLILKIK